LGETISSGKAAAVAGLSKVDVIDELDRREIPYFTETPAELEAQVAAVRALFGNAGNQP
jgi:hypothetical protein